MIIKIGHLFLQFNRSQWTWHEPDLFFQIWQNLVKYLLWKLKGRAVVTNREIDPYH